MKKTGRNKWWVVAIAALLIMSLAACGTKKTKKASRTASSRESHLSEETEADGNFLSAKSVAEKYTEAYALNDILTMDKYSVYSRKEWALVNYVDEEDFCDSMSDTYEEDLTSWKDYCKYVREERKEELEDDYGEFDLDIEAKREEDISIETLKSEFSYLIESLEEDLDFDIDDYKKAKDVMLKYKIDGEDDKEKGTMHIYLLKDGLGWKVLCAD